MVYNDLWRITEPTEDGICLYTNQECIHILEKYLAIMDIVIEDKNYGIFAIQLFGTQFKLAQYHMLEEELEKVVECLRAATEHAIWYDTQLHAGSEYTCLLFNNIGIGTAFTNSNENQCMILLHRLEKPEFDPVREHPEFKKIIEELQKYAKKL